MRITSEQASDLDIEALRKSLKESDVLSIAPITRPPSMFDKIQKPVIVGYDVFVTSFENYIEKKVAIDLSKFLTSNNTTS